MLDHAGSGTPLQTGLSRRSDSGKLLCIQLQLFQQQIFHANENGGLAERIGKLTANHSGARQSSRRESESRGRFASGQPVPMKDCDRAEFRLRPPTLEDAPKMWELVCQSEVLDVNSPYLYLLLCRDFARTSLVATCGDRLSGFVTGYRPPERPDVLFVWQVAVSPEDRRRGLARRMLCELVARCRSDDLRFVEATIADGNQNSNRLFAALARELDAPLTRSVGFREEDFPHADHDAEPLVRIGPFVWAAISP